MASATPDLWLPSQPKLVLGKFTDLDFADDVSLLADLLELLVPILETPSTIVARRQIGR